MIAPANVLSLACCAMNRRIVALTAAAIFAVTGALLRPAMAETVEVAPGIEVTRKAFKAPASEAPFLGLVDKEPTLRKTDDVFISLAVEVYGSHANVLGRFLGAAGRRWRRRFGAGGHALQSGLVVRARAKPDISRLCHDRTGALS